MDIRHLTHIVALADKRNFARAAEQINLSQPALTRSIQAAEAELGMRLFDRGGAEVTPTPAGQFLLERARRLVFDSRCLKRDMELYRDSKLGDIAFGVGPFPAASLLPSLLVDIRTDFPRINVRAVVGSWDLLVKQLREEMIEFLIVHIRDLPRHADLHLRPLLREPAGFYVRAGHPLIGVGALSSKDVWRYGVASVRLPAEVQAFIAERLELPIESALPLAVECDNIETLTRVALATDTVLAAPHYAIAPEIATGALLPIKIDDLPPMAAEVGIVTLRGRASSPMAETVQKRLSTLLMRRNIKTP